MGYSDLDMRTLLLLRALRSNGIQIVIGTEDELQAMQQMVEERLFYYSDAMFSEGYWWTPAGEQAAKEAWERVPVQHFETRYRGHPQVCFDLNGYKDEYCYVIRPSDGSKLWVRGSDSHWLIDHPNGQENVPFGSADDAIAWALEEIGKGIY